MQLSSCKLFTFRILRIDVSACGTENAVITFPSALHGIRMGRRTEPRSYQSGQMHWQAQVSSKLGQHRSFLLRTIVASRKLQWYLRFAAELELVHKP